VTSCLVLGGAGFIGSHLSQRLLELGHRVRVFDRPGAGGLALFRPAASLDVVTGDFLEARDLERALEGIETVFHLVSTTLPKSSNERPEYDLESNVLGTLRLLEICRRRAARKIVFVSSGGTVYGIPQSLPIAETHPTEPICAYGIHKLAIEKYLHLNHFLHGLDYCALRPANLYGERQRADAAQGAVAVFLGRALAGGPIEIWGDGSATRDYLYVGDAVEALVRAIDHAGAPRVFNLGTGVGTSLNDLVRQIEILVGHSVQVQRAPARSLDVPANVLDCALAERALGWRARTPLAEGLRRTLAWLRAR
jgi:UDP-glucose 4-epimerase